MAGKIPKTHSQVIGSGSCVVAVGVGRKQNIRFDSPKDLLSKLARLLPQLVRQPTPNPNISPPILRLGGKKSLAKQGETEEEIQKLSIDLEEAFKSVRRLTQQYDLDQTLLGELEKLQNLFLERGKADIRAKSQ
jgi:hypothetical protein